MRIIDNPFSLKTLPLLALALAAAPGTSSASIQKSIRISPIQLRDVSKDANRSVTVYYANGLPARFETDGGVPVIRTIEAGPVDARVSSDGSVRLPAISVRQARLQPFNYLVVIVHRSGSEPKMIKNANGTMPSSQGTVSASGIDPQSFDNDRVVYLPVRLDSSMSAIAKIGSTAVAADRSNRAPIIVPIILDLGGGR